MTSKKAYHLTGEVADYVIDLLDTKLDSLREQIEECGALVSLYTKHGEVPDRRKAAEADLRELAHQYKIAEEAYDTLRSLDGQNGDTFHERLITMPMETEAEARAFIDAVVDRRIAEENQPC